MSMNMITANELKEIAMKRVNERLGFECPDIPVYFLDKSECPDAIINKMQAVLRWNSRELQVGTNRHTIPGGIYIASIFNLSEEQVDWYLQIKYICSKGTVDLPNTFEEYKAQTNLDEFREFLYNNDVETRIDSIIRCIGHYIHVQYFDSKAFRFQNGCKGADESFKYCFLDYITHGPINYHTKRMESLINAIKKGKYTARFSNEEATRKMNGIGK